MAYALDQVERSLSLCGGSDSRGCHRLTLEEAADLLPELLPGFRHGYGGSFPALCATQAKAGSEEKIRVMQTRVSRGESPFHPADPYYSHQSDEESDEDGNE